MKSRTSLTSTCDLDRFSSKWQSCILDIHHARNMLSQLLDCCFLSKPADDRSIMTSSKEIAIQLCKKFAASSTTNPSANLEHTNLLYRIKDLKLQVKLINYANVSFFITMSTDYKLFVSNLMISTCSNIINFKSQALTFLYY